MKKPPPPEHAFWKVFNTGAGFHRRVYRLTGGRLGGRIGRSPVLLLDHVGRRSGQARTSPLIYARDGDRLVVVASKGGVDKHPAWFHNVMAAPETTAQVGSRRLPVRARVASEEEREVLWPKVVAVYEPYEQYQSWTSRRIPLVILEPR